MGGSKVCIGLAGIFLIIDGVIGVGQWSVFASEGESVTGEYGAIVVDACE